MGRRECHPCQEEVNRTMAALKHLQGCHNAPPHQSVLQRPENPHLRAEMSLRRRRLARINAYTVHCTHLLLLRVVHADTVGLYTFERASTRAVSASQCAK